MHFEVFCTTFKASVTNLQHRTLNIQFTNQQKKTKTFQKLVLEVNSGLLRNTLFSPETLDDRHKLAKQLMTRHYHWKNNQAVLLESTTWHGV